MDVLRKFLQGNIFSVVLFNILYNLTDRFTINRTGSLQYFYKLLHIHQYPVFQFPYTFAMAD